MSGLQITADQMTTINKELSAIRHRVVNEESDLREALCDICTMINYLASLANAAPAASEPEPLRVEVGKWYERRDGRITGPLKHTSPGTMFAKTHPFQVGCNTYRECGRYAPLDDDQDCPSDLIREVPAPQIAKRSDPFPTKRATYTCGCEAGGHLVSASCPIHNEPEVPAPVPVGECGHDWAITSKLNGSQKCCLCGATRTLSERISAYAEATTTTPAPPKFKVGDRVRVKIDTGITGNGCTVQVAGGLDGWVFNVTESRPCQYMVEVDGGDPIWCNESDLSLNPTTPASPSTRTIELFDGACVCCEFDGTKYYRVLRQFGKYWMVLDLYGEYYAREAIECLLNWEHYTRDPSRDQHPVGSEWELGGERYWLNRIGSRFALCQLIAGQNVYARGNQWKPTIAEATRGARRADVVSVEVA